MTKSALVQSIHVPARLGRMLRLSGGNARDEAIVTAEKGVEKLRERFCAALSEEIEKLGWLIQEASDINDDMLSTIQVHAGVIFNLAGTYGFKALQGVAASLLDLLVLMRSKSIKCWEPVTVHIFVAKLLWRSSPALDSELGDELVKQLRKVVARFEA